jgi:hypothetical protein
MKMKTAKKQSVKSGLISVNLWATFVAVLLMACETREEPVRFKLEAKEAYTFTETASAASFSVTSNIPWKAEVTDGNEWCRVTPGAAKGDGEAEISVTANTAYLLERTAVITVTAGEFSIQITVTQAPPPCPAFSAGSIAVTGQTLFASGTPAAINSLQNASGGDGQISYQWYKNSTAISGATATSYTPPPADAATVGAHTYTRRAKDNSCYTTLTPSEGSWVLTVTACPFNAGAIDNTGQTIIVGETPATINSTQVATGEGTVSYQWYKNSTAISGATATSYTPPPADAAAVGAHTYTRRAKDNICNTTLTQSAGSWVLTVTCPFNAGAIANTGQTITVGGTPATINSTQVATGNGTVSYQWYKNSMAISSATATSYTPPLTDAAVVGAYTYTRSAKNNTCNTTFTQSAGRWVLTVEACNFNAGTIATTGQTITVGGTPATINSTQAATGNGTVSYQWYKNGNAISGATATSYTPSSADAHTVGAHTYTRYAKDNTCNTTFTQSTGSWVLTVITATDNTPPNVASTKTWTFGDLLWSDAIRMPDCNHTDFTESYTSPYCRSYSSGATWYYYNWTYVNTKKTEMCPNPWRVPTKADFDYLASRTTLDYLSTEWGYGGYASGSGMNYVTSDGYYWSSEQYDGTYAYRLYFYPSVGIAYKRYGYQVRCVKEYCPPFNAGVIASTGQTVVVGGTPTTINSLIAASGGKGSISYQWYKNGYTINGATGANYTPPQADANTVGSTTYTRRAKDNTCNTTLTQSAGSWVLTVTCNFNTGAIDNTGQTIAVGGIPSTINSLTVATGGDGVYGYQWYKDGAAISGATLTGYTPPQADANVAGSYTYTRRAKDNTCNTTLTQSAGSWVLTVIPCNFNAGAIDNTGQTIVVGSTPAAINSTQDATGGAEQISYQWYKNGATISGATATSYTPPPADASAVGTHTYTRRAKDNTCTTTLTQSAGSWVLTITCPFNAGAIDNTGQTMVIGETPATINSTQEATGDGVITYQWYKNGATISGATAASYTPPQADANAVGAYTYTRRAKNNTCNTILTQSTGSWILTVRSCNFTPGAIATTGQSILVGATPAIINSVQNAAGGGEYTYQWYKNGNAISGATAPSYTPAQEDANMVGAHTYTRRAKDNICKTTLTQSAGSWVLKVTCPSFNAGAIDNTGQTICIGNTVNTITSSTDATSEDGNISYQWRRNDADLSSANAATYNPVAYNTTIGAHTFTRWAHNGSCNTEWTQSTGTWILNVTEVKLTLTTTNNTQTVASGAAITPIEYTITSANSVSVSGLPDGITNNWASDILTISGSSTETGTHNYTVTATAPGCSNAYDYGTFTIIASSASCTIDPCTWTAGTQTWSGAKRILVSGCSQVTTLNHNMAPPAQYKIGSSSHGYYYNWACVSKSTLCTSPWRMPTLEDFRYLLNHTSAATLGMHWGYGGYAERQFLQDVTSGARYYSSEYRYTYGYGGYALMYGRTDGYSRYGIGPNEIQYGIQVRCVK